MKVQMSGLDDLNRDIRRLPAKAATRMARIVRTRAEQGNRRAKSSARRTAGAHGHHYPTSFFAEPVTPYQWTYGPVSFVAQGGMSFEYGSRNQKPHLDLAKSADVVGPKLGSDVEKMLDELFW